MCTGNYMETKVDALLDWNEDIINTITVKKMLMVLDEEEQDIIKLWMSNSFTLEEIGRIVGQKYYQQDMKASKVSYYRNKILKKLQSKFNSQD